MPKKILLADDSITIQKVVGITLANEDVQITSVDNGEDAIARARDIVPDLVLADASMPKKDGYQVAEALKGDPATAGIPVLILAGQLEGHPDQARLAACRADGFIPKPFQSQELIDRVRKVLGLAPGVAAPARTLAPPAASVAAPAARPATAAAAAPTPAAKNDNVPTIPAMAAAPRPAAAPVAAPAPAPAPARAPAPAPAPVPASATVPSPAPAINEADFGELSGAPASSGDQDLWNENSVPAAAAAEENLWGDDHGGTPPAGVKSAAAPARAASSAPSPAAATQLVTNKAELANLESFAPDDSPSGLDLDDSVPMRKAPAVAAASSTGTNGHVSEDVAAALASIPPEKLEAIVREVARSILQPILEKIAWEVVPDLAEDIIKDEIKRLTAG